MHYKKERKEERERERKRRRKKRHTHTEKEGGKKEEEDSTILTFFYTYKLFQYFDLLFSKRWQLSKIIIITTFVFIHNGNEPRELVQ